MTGQQEEGLQTHGHCTVKGVCVRKTDYHRGAGWRLQHSLHTSPRTELVPRRKRTSLGVARKRNIYLTGLRRPPFPFPIPWKFQQQQISRFESGNLTGKLNISPRKRNSRKQKLSNPETFVVQHEVCGTFVLSCVVWCTGEKRLRFVYD